jgi:hypothetical protein
MTTLEQLEQQKKELEKQTEVAAQNHKKKSYFNLLRKTKNAFNFLLIQVGCLMAIGSATANSDITCFDYTALGSGEEFVSGFSAAACYGYYAASQESANPQLFSQLEMQSEAADVMEDELCESRQISIGLNDESLPSKFEQGYRTAHANAAQAQDGAMKQGELQTRMGACAKVILHYGKVLEAFGEQ